MKTFTRTIDNTCSGCGRQSWALIVQTVNTVTIRQIVFDACPKCGKKQTNYKEVFRHATDEETKARKFIENVN